MTRLIPLAILIGLISGCDARSVPGSAGSASAPAMAAQRQEIVRWQYVGTAPLAGETNAARLRQVLAEPATQNLLKDVLSKLARSVTNLAPTNLAAPRPDPTAWLAPILDDLFRAESVGSYQSAASKGTGLTLAVRLAPDRVRLWQTNWNHLVTGLGAGPLAEVHGDGYVGWEAKWPAAPTLSRLLQAADWTVLSWGNGGPPIPVGWLSRIKTSGRPADPDKEAWLWVDADLGRLATLLHWPASVTWPQADVKFFGRGANVRAQGRLKFAQPLSLKPEPWRIPTNTMSDPLVGFTAVQGLRSWLSVQPWVKDLALPSVPNQVYSWAQARIPFRTYLSWELPDRTNALLQLAPRLPALVTNQLYWAKHGRVMVETNRTRVTWFGLPLAEPFLQPAADPGFVVAGIFPLSQRFTPAPAELYAQVLGRTNLVYYDWELTQVRVDDWRQLKDVYEMAAGYQPSQGTTPASAWLTDTNVISHLSNAATEVTEVSPTELDLVRSSSVGFTGLELVMLMRWIDDPAFPKLSEPKINPSLLRRDQPKPPGVRAPRPQAKPPGTNRPPASGRPLAPANASGLTNPAASPRPQR